MELSRSTDEIVPPGRAVTRKRPPAVRVQPIVIPARRSTWDRVAITDDVEIHVRRPLPRPARERVRRLIAAADALFAEDHGRR